VDMWERSFCSCAPLDLNQHLRGEPGLSRSCLPFHQARVVPTTGLEPVRSRGIQRSQRCAYAVPPRRRGAQGRSRTCTSLEGSPRSERGASAVPPLVRW
jgi:hypothetical protein